MASDANPYIDDQLLKNLQTYSPNANEAFLAAHSAEDPLEVFVVRVILMSGHNLPPTDMLTSSSDPYCKLIIDDKPVAQSKTIERNLNPVWNEEFEFKFFSQPSKLKFELFDSDRGMLKDDRIGGTKFDLKRFFTKQPRTESGEIEPYVADKKLKGGKGASIQFKVLGRKFRPMVERRLVDGQQIVIQEKNAEIHSMQQQHRRLLAQHEQLLKSRKQTDEHVDAPKVKAAVQAKQQSSVPVKKQSVCVLIRVWHFLLNLIVYQLPLIGHINDNLVLYIGYLLRLGMFQTVDSTHRSASQYKLRPAALLKLYDIEGDVQCKQVRETLSVLDLDCIIHPSFHDKVPVLVDENTHRTLNGNEAIISYLHETYGGIEEYLSPFQRFVQYVVNMRLSLFLYSTLYLSILRCLPQHGRGPIVSSASRGTERNDNLLELWSMEAAPSSTKVREVLSSLEICYILRNTVSPKEKQLPVLIDTSTDTEIAGDAEKMKQYLLKTYA